ncbi:MULTISPECIES: hypothetical protein [Sphingobacterium]|uniref:hypothetical protein n=1 Tax=Sphingobacterium TaxID=28453 RepID=UPI0025805559|nr:MULTISPECIES: hypothetical protein [Sphingobacterium]
MKIKLLILSFITIASYNAFGQRIDEFKKYFTGKDEITTISDIKTKNDFDQTNMSPAEIDEKIQKMLDEPVADLDIPINSAKLIHLGKNNPLKVIDLDSTSFVRDMPMINKDLEIFSYDGVFILVPDKSPKNLLNIFFTARALQILKVKYPQAYLYLIAPDQVELGYKKLKPGEYRPILNKITPIISFDKSPTKIAGSLWNMVWAKEPTRLYEGVKNFENKFNALTSINYETDRPKEIYQKNDTLDNYYFYLREGLLESIVHEFTHHYISNFRNFDKKANFIYNKRYDLQDKTFSFDAEEAIVINTTESYFVKVGGLSKKLINFNLAIKYKDKKEKLINMDIPINKERFEKLKELSNASTFDGVYRLDFYK